MHIFTTHSQSGERTEIRQIKHRQLRELLAFIRAQKIPRNEAVILTGDLNIDRFKHPMDYAKTMYRLRAQLPSVTTSDEGYRTCLPYDLWTTYIQPWLDGGDTPPAEAIQAFRYVWKKIPGYEEAEKKNALVPFAEEKREDFVARAKLVKPATPWTVCKMNDLENPLQIPARDNNMRTEWLDYILYFTDYLVPVAGTFETIADWMYGKKPTRTPEETLALIPGWFGGKKKPDPLEKRYPQEYKSEAVLKESGTYFNDLSDHYPVYATFYFPFQPEEVRGECPRSRTMPAYRPGEDFSLP